MYVIALCFHLILVSYSDENLRFTHPTRLLLHRKKTEYTQGTLTTENSRMAVKSRASIACMSNFVCSFYHHARRPRGKRLNRCKGPRRYAQQRPSSVHYFYIIIIEYTHINLPYQVHLLRIFPLHLPSLETPQSTRLPPAHPRSSRMSTFPLVGSALRVYEQGKASSRVVKVRLPSPYSSP